MNLKKTVFFYVLLFATSTSAYAKPTVLILTSPDKNITVSINADKRITYGVNYEGKTVLLPSQLSLTLGDGKVLGVNSKVDKVAKRSVNQSIKPVYGMATAYNEVFNEMTISFKNNFKLIFRVFNNGVAYRFATALPGKIQVKEEQINYRFEQDINAWLQLTKSFNFSYEADFVQNKISSIPANSMAALPLTAESNGVRIVLAEADLLDYPGYYITYKGDNTLQGVSPKFVLKDKVGGQSNFNRIPTESANYIAETDGTRSFPWRLMVVAENDKYLLYNNLVYLLASDNKIGDTSWIKPGKVAWDWWNAVNITGVDFKSGFNTETYKYFIDFAAKNKLEYIMMDEGWSDQFDLLKVNDGSVVTDGSTKLSGKLDMPYLFNYAKQKGVGIILWCVWHTLDRQMIEALDQFQKWGVKGVKVDFMNRDDQTVVNFYERLAKEAAKRKMIVDFHAAYKPTGLDRTYPNIVNYEGVQGLEFNKFSTADLLHQATILPFTRMIAGPMDYTPGGMTNASKEDFKVSFYRPMTLGTRCNQLAMFTVFYAPFEMLADSPTAYENEPEILNYLSDMPCVWDETRPIDGKIGDFAVVARRKGTTWHVGGLNSWTAKQIKLTLDFLEVGDYTATIFTDGVNAERIGSDYKMTVKQITVKQITKGSTLLLDMASGGGFAIKLEKTN